MVTSTFFSLANFWRTDWLGRVSGPRHQKPFEGRTGSLNFSDTTCFAQRFSWLRQTQAATAFPSFQPLDASLFSPQISVDRGRSRR
ncbi:unnamed protein product [Chondrus crispus]|uniref:Uncharacterized protein n=1 Tax=Chondrus crispus TaxID=2769 RepID=R7QF70_CHOCR|nr:unnamed protein product [Chondrus crispus]CDF37172.1 unnamed protein product [Chondrus crispus]|eukprot:XP_005716991.1 unnamed protein product [Chondrus crispus]